MIVNQLQIDRKTVFLRPEHMVQALQKNLKK